jgi:L-alanine-DL-glutamate epimerase-like enolase superfamily enzyme
VHALLGGAVRQEIVPYASLLPTGVTLAEYEQSLLEKLAQARARGFRAAKLEVCISGPYAHNGLRERDEAAIDIVAACRELVGPEFVLMVDVAYAWPDAKAALRMLDRLEPFGLFFVETPIDIDDLSGYRYLHDHSPIRIAAGEWQNTHFEFLDLADTAQVDVLQPDVGRVGGFTEARKVVQIAADRGKLVVPHCWKSGIGIAASAHLSAASACSPYIEFLPADLSESPLRRDLLIEEPQLVDGVLSVSQAPGLGVNLNRDALRKYRVE